MGTPREIKLEMQTRLERYIVNVDQLDNSGYRTQEIADARCELVWRIHTEHPRLTSTQIANHVGLDRSTVSYWLGKPFCKVGGVVGRMAEQERLRKAAEQAEKERQRMLRFHASAALRTEWSQDRFRDPAVLEREAQVRARLLERQRRERELIERVPADVRSITGRLCGDPLPGRSALDQRRVAA